MFQSANEPEAWVPARESVADYVLNVQVQSDAVRCAVADVNRIYNENLDVKYVGPVLASSSVGALPIACMQGNRTDYHGNSINYNIYDWFDRHK